MKRLIIVMSFIMMLALTIAGTVYVYAFDITSITADDFQTEEPKVDHGSNNDYGNLSDTFRDVAKMDNEYFDGKVLDKANKEITTFTVMLLSIIIYLIFAMTAFTTACDLLYIGFPPIRPYLYDENTRQSNQMMGNYVGQNGNYMQQRGDYSNQGVPNQYGRTYQGQHRPSSNRNMYNNSNRGI